MFSVLGPPVTAKQSAGKKKSKKSSKDSSKFSDHSRFSVAGIIPEKSSGQLKAKGQSDGNRAPAFDEKTLGKY